MLLLLRTLYNFLLHPLHSYPGPWYAKSSIAWFVYHTFKGDHVFLIHQLHLRYGPVVRVAPNELSFIDAQAWKDIYGYRPGVDEFAKDASERFSEDPAHPNIIVADRERHATLRRLLSNAFSDKAMRGQIHILSDYTMKLVECLRARTSEPVDMVKWYNVCE